LLDESLQAEIRTAYQKLVAAKGLNPRLGQRQMIAEVANAFGDPDAPAPIAVVEAGTGTGKTIAYTLAGVPVAKARGKHLVIATATVALQEQLLHKDLPDILAHSGLEFSVRLAKGRGRYVCLQKLDHGLSGLAAPVLIPLYPDEFDDADTCDPAMLESMLDALGRGEWDGDLDAWPVALSSRQRREVTSDAFQCTGRRCPHVTQCSFFRAREGLAEVDVIVTNQDLVLSDLKLGGGAILPPPEDCLYVFDEGHRLPEKCLQHFVLNVRASSTEQALIELANGLAQAEQELVDSLGSGELVASLHTSCEDLRQLTLDAEAETQVLLDELDPGCEEYRFEQGVIPPALVAAAIDLAACWRQHLDLAARLEASLERLVESADAGSGEGLDAWLGNAQAMVTRAESQLALWESYAGAATAPEGVPDWARWVRRAGNESRLDWRASPILASELLATHLWSRAAGAAVSSATLSALGRFDRFVARSGIPVDARMQRVASPFDPSRVVFSVPAMRSDPGNADEHTDEICALLPSLLEGHTGALVLFSSRRQMEAVADQLRGALSAEMLLQDQLSKAELLAGHRANVDRGQASVIFGLASFAEGIDLPGDYCSHVVVAKLPFAVPDDPLESAHAERVSAEGGNPFMEISVPDAALKLTQACGRLQRTEGDSGRITLLDRRIVDRRYGRDILNTLPRYRFELPGKGQ
jgi:ATP-dependent DNA helicase DinG